MITNVFRNFFITPIIYTLKLLDFLKYKKMQGCDDVQNSFFRSSKYFLISAFLYEQMIGFSTPLLLVKTTLIKSIFLTTHLEQNLAYITSTTNTGIQTIYMVTMIFAIALVSFNSLSCMKLKPNKLFVSSEPELDGDDELKCSRDRITCFQIR